MRPGLPGALALHLGARDSGFDPGVHPPAVGGQVGVAVGGDQLQAALFSPVDPVFELARLASKTVEVVADDRGEASGVVVGDHLVVGGALLRLVGRSLGLVDVGLDHFPATELGQVLAVLALALDGQPVQFAVLRDAQVDRCPDGRCGVGGGCADHASSISA